MSAAEIAETGIAETGMAETESLDIDHVALRAWRLGRLRAEMAKRDMAAVVLTDAVNIRYASGARNMQVFTSRNPWSRYLFVPVNGPVVLFEFAGSEHLSAQLETIGEIRPATNTHFYSGADRQPERERKWADEIADLARRHAGLSRGGRCRIGVEDPNPRAAGLLAEKGFEIVDAQHAVEIARAIKGPEELLCVRESLRATETGVGKRRDAIRPGLTENELWSVLHQSIIAAGADYVVTSLLYTPPSPRDRTRLPMPSTA